MSNTETADMEIFTFLDQLRESGTMNMMGAPSVIREMFDVDQAEAFAVFKRWTETFDK